MKEQKDWESFYSSFSSIKLKEKHFSMASFIKSICEDAKDIIDIGCGSGEYSIAFSHEFEKVIALDISDSLINKLIEEAKDKIDNIEFIASDYQNYYEKHDISFLSFSPVIQNIDDLKRVIKQTNKSVFILTVDEGSYDYHRFELIKLLPPRKMGGFIKNAKWIEESLGSLNIDYQSKSFTESSEEKMDREYAIEYFVSYFMAIGYKKEEVEGTITKYIDDNLDDNNLIEKHKLNTKLIFFKI